MSFLTPLYVLGLLAVAAPIIFHLIRRSPRGEVPFSSLMFLAPSPPRLTRRSRLDNLLLLLLRAAALTLLAIAFARPFLRQAAQLDFGNVQSRRIAVLIDTSASMRRGDLWQKAKAMADQVIRDAQPSDELAVFSFDATFRPLLSFEESKTLDPARRAAVAKAGLAQLSPTWGSTQLGQALIDAVAAIEDVADASEKAGRMPRRVVLISDLQQGSRLDALGDFEWPSDVELELKRVSDTGSNAGLHMLADLTGTGTEAGEAAAERRVRVSNDLGSKQDQFELVWMDDKGEASGKPIDVYVPPGESRVVRLPEQSARLPEQSARTPQRVLRLTGDAHRFDNTLYFTSERRDEATVVYIGADGADDPAGLLYYLERVFEDTPQRTVRIAVLSPSAKFEWDPKASQPLVILATETTPENVRGLQEYMRGGGNVLDVVTAPGRLETLAALADVSAWDVPEAAVNRDVMLGEIAFDHPLFAPLAGAQFNDFTKIHFWKYRRLDPSSLEDARVLARFENGDAAVVEKGVGKGRLIILASGWQPADSQLARSSKFVPLMSALLEGRNAQPLDQAYHLVNDRVPLPAQADDAQALVVKKPDGSVVPIGPKSGFFDETDEPGIYTIELGAGARAFAVNLDPMESKTSPLHLETLEQFGCRLASPFPNKSDRESLRQLHNVELEGRQKLWRWLILAAIGVLIVETWLAGRLSRPRLARAEVSE